MCRLPYAPKVQKSLLHEPTSNQEFINTTHYLQFSWYISPYQYFVSPSVAGVQPSALPQEPLPCVFAVKFKILCQPLNWVFGLHPRSFLRTPYMRCLTPTVVSLPKVPCFCKESNLSFNPVTRQFTDWITLLTKHVTYHYTSHFKSVDPFSLTGCQSSFSSTIRNCKKNIASFISLPIQAGLLTNLKLCPSICQDVIWP